MGKNILVLTGSPRQNGNTDTLAAAFVEGAKGAGHTISVFNAAATTVQGCRACDACWSNGQACVFEDGFRELAPILAEAEVLVLASPVYWFDFSAQIKAAIDKFYSFMVPASPQPLKLKESVLLLCAEDDRPEVFDGPVATYRGMGDYLKLTDRGMITVPAVHKRGDIAGNAALEKAKALGASI